MRFGVATVALLLLASSATAFQSSGEPSLAEVAKKEKQRREKIKGPVRVVTEADLGGPSQSAAPAPEAAASGSGQAKPATAAAASKSPDEIREEKRVELQRKVDEQVKRIAELQNGVDQAQARLNDVTNLTFGPGRQSLIDFIDKAKADIAKAEATIADIEEQARRAGVRVSR